MKSLITALIFIWTVGTTSFHAKTIKLNYEPKVKIVKISFDSLTIYTDTSSIFSVYRNEHSIDEYSLRIKNLISKHFINTNSDTAYFTGDLIPFNDGIESNNSSKY